jgi:hypothetical protein
MTEEQANALQAEIYERYPALPVIVRNLGGVFVCLIAYRGYYLWTWEDWLAYRDSHKGALQAYEREKRAC